MRVALGLITCERFDYTRRTLETFAAYSDLASFVLLHGDDASSDDRVGPLARSFGFQTLRNVDRSGVMATQRLVAHEAQAQGCDWTVILQNDWESVRPFPWTLFGVVANDPAVYCMRLYGVQKDRGERKAGQRHKGKGGADAGWRPYNGPEYDWPIEPAEIGSIHWSSPPAATRTDLLVWLLDGAERDRDCRIKSGSLDLMTVRPIENVVYHIGEERTPDFKS